MKKFLMIVIAILLAVPAFAQRLNLDLPGLSEKASEIVDVTLDANMLRLASRFLSKNDVEERAVRDMVQKLEGIYVRSYTFDSDGAYDLALVDRVRSQLGPNWSKIVNVRSKSKENVEIFTQSRGDAIVGLVVISAEPRELTLVNIVGPIDLDRLADLEGQFGIPKISKEKERQ